MAAGVAGQPTCRGGVRAAALAAIAACLAVGGCAQGTGEGGGPLASLASLSPLGQKDSVPEDPLKAVEYRGKQYSENPRDLDKALAYAESLKAAGQKQQALAVLQQASMLHGSDRRLASDYGRLALDLDQVSAAKKLLEVADDPANPDWRVIMGRGTVLAKEGKYQEAISFYERAQALAPNNPSVMNNLGMAYTMSGEPAKAEEILRRALDVNGANAKVRQNLALVLGLQGKYDEAIQVGSIGQPADNAQANTELLRKIVKLEPKASGTAGQASNTAMASAFAGSWDAEVAEDPPATKVKPTAYVQPAAAHAWREALDEEPEAADEAEAQALARFSAVAESVKSPIFKRTER